MPTFDIGSKLAELKQTRKLGTAITMKVDIIVIIIIIIIISISKNIVIFIINQNRT